MTLVVRLGIVSIMDTETWKPVIGYEGYYEVSDFGRVRSMNRWVKHQHGGDRKLKGKIMAGGSQLSGHRCVVLCRENQPHTQRIHRLVLEAFAGPAPSGMCARHLDGNPKNNRIDNLTWGTMLENSADRIRHGRSNKGERHGISKLTDSKVIKMREIRRLTGESYSAIGAKFGVSYRTAGRAIRGESWSHI